MLLYVCVFFFCLSSIGTAHMYLVVIVDVYLMLCVFMNEELCVTWQTESDVRRAG